MATFTATAGNLDAKSSMSQITRLCCFATAWLVVGSVGCSSPLASATNRCELAIKPGCICNAAPLRPRHFEPLPCHRIFHGLPLLRSPAPCLQQVSSPVRCAFRTLCFGAAASLLQQKMCGSSSTCPGSMDERAGSENQRRCCKPCR